MKMQKITAGAKAVFLSNLLSFGVQPFATPYDKVKVNTTTLVFNSFIHSDL